VRCADIATGASAQYRDCPRKKRSPAKGFGLRDDGFFYRNQVVADRRRQHGKKRVPVQHCQKCI
jgi:hypothetical protein